MPLSIARASLSPAVPFCSATRVILWNTRYTQRTLDTLRAEGLEVQSEDVAQLSPLGYDHIMILRRYQCVVLESVQRGEFHPLRTSHRRGGHRGSQSLDRFSVPLLLATHPQP